MKGGRKAKPNVIKLREGNVGKQKLNLQEPKPPAYLGPRPCYTHWWPKDAKAFWSRWVPILRKMGVFSKVDIPAMEALCHSYAQFNAMVQHLKDNGVTFTSPNGHIIQRPEVAIARRALKDMEGLLAEFGMTPASRGKIKADVPSSKDLDDMLD